VRVLPAMSGAVWLAALLWNCWRDLQTWGTVGITSQTDWPCVVSIATGGAVLGGPMLLMLRRGAPLTPRTTALLGGVAALSFANIEACLTRPHTFTMTVLAWHGITIALAASLLRGSVAAGCVGPPGRLPSRRTSNRDLSYERRITTTEVHRDIAADPHKRSRKAATMRFQRHRSKERRPDIRLLTAGPLTRRNVVLMHSWGSTLMASLPGQQ
jgi:hypothetical protein